jgi:hypothetical protein
LSKRDSGIKSPKWLEACRHADGGLIVPCQAALSAHPHGFEFPHLPTQWFESRRRPEPVDDLDDLLHRLRSPWRRHSIRVPQRGVVARARTGRHICSPGV